MAETNAEKLAMCDIRAGRGNKITYHSSDPGTTGANLVATTPASANTTWGAAVIDGANAVSTGSQVTMTAPASASITHYGVWNGATFLRGKALDSAVTLGAGAVLVGCTPKCIYTGN